MAICVTVTSGTVMFAGDAVFTNGAYGCNSGSYLMLSPPETNALVGSPFVAGPEHYTAISIIFGAALTALSVVWGLKKVLRLFNSHTEA